MSDRESVVKMIADLDADAQEHFRDLLRIILPCYGANDYHCVVIVMEGDSPMINIRTISANEMYSLQALQHALDFFEFLNVRDAPAKENFN